MDTNFQFFVDIIMAIVALLGGWLFKVMFSNANKQREEIQDLYNRQREDYRKLSDEMVALALSLPVKPNPLGEKTPASDSIAKM